VETEPSAAAAAGGGAAAGVAAATNQHYLLYSTFGTIRDIYYEKLNINFVKLAWLQQKVYAHSICYSEVGTEPSDAAAAAAAKG
jgi:hypothetical protein